MLSFVSGANPTTSEFTTTTPVGESIAKVGEKCYLFPKRAILFAAS
jgi:hypothetical protein